MSETTEILSDKALKEIESALLLHVDGKVMVNVEHACALSQSLRAAWAECENLQASETFWRAEALLEHFCSEHAKNTRQAGHYCTICAKPFVMTVPQGGRPPKYEDLVTENAALREQLAQANRCHVDAEEDLASAQLRIDELKSRLGPSRRRVEHGPCGVGETSFGADTTMNTYERERLQLIREKAHAHPHNYHSDFHFLLSLSTNIMSDNNTDRDEQQGGVLGPYWEFGADGHVPKPTLRECPLCRNGGQPYFTRTVNGTNMIYVGCSQCGLELKAALVMVTPTKEQPSKDIVTIWNTRSRAFVAAVEVKARYEKAHDARYMMAHAVHPDIVVLWFLALKSHWFDNPDNLFYGQREQAKAYLYKWVETGELAPCDTMLEITTEMKFREWLESSWTTAAASSSAPAESKNTETIARFRDLKQNWDSYNAPPIRSEAIEIALLLAPVLPDWQPVPRSDGGIQFERDDHEINIDTYPTEPLTEPKDNKDA